MSQKIYKIFDNDKFINENNLNGNLREFFQRNAISNGLKEANDDDIIIISDVDEIPILDNINFKSINKKVQFFLIKFFAVINLICTQV